MDLAALVARATDRALSRCAEDDPPRVVALRVAVAILRELQRAGVRLPGQNAPRQSPVVNTTADTTAAKR